MNALELLERERGNLERHIDIMKRMEAGTYNIIDFEKQKEELKDIKKYKGKVK